MKGLFIVIEGPDGSGKSTIANMLYDKLLEEGYKIILTREPGGIDIAEQIRNVIHDTNNTAMDKKTEALLYAASRRQHLVEKIIPALNNGYIVLCDRFIDSSLAYQGYGREIGIEEVYNLNMFAIEGTMPDLTLFFDVTPAIGLERIHKNKNREVNRLDLEKIDFHNKVYDGYQIVLEKYKDRITKIDASKDIDIVFEASYKIIRDKICQNENF